jgi:predicted transcriptional regulator
MPKVRRVGWIIVGTVDIFVRSTTVAERYRPMSRKKHHSVTSPADWETLISPARSEIAEAIRLLGPCSIAEIAQAIGRPADSLYRHIEILIGAGFVVEAGYRKGERNAERLVDVVAEDFHVEFSDNSGSAENRAIVRTANSFLSAMGRTIRDSAGARQLIFDAGNRNLSINYELSWLTPAQFQEVRSLIRRIKQVMDQGKVAREGRLYATLSMACPVTRKRQPTNPSKPRDAKKTKVVSTLAAKNSKAKTTPRTRSVVSSA